MLFRIEAKTNICVRPVGAKGVNDNVDIVWVDNQECIQFNSSAT